MSGYKKNGKFFIINCKSDDVDFLSNLEDKLDLAYDWYRINDGSYVLYTSKNADKWTLITANLSKNKYRFFICALDVSDMQGWMPVGFWKWIKEKRKEID